MSPIAVVVSIIVALIGLAGVGLTAWAGMRSNALRLQAEDRAKLVDEERQREAAEAVARKVEAEGLRVDRDRIIAYHEGLHTQHAAEMARKDAEIARLTVARDRENAEVLRLRAVLASKENPS